MNRIEKLLKVLCGFLLIALIVLLAASVLMRYVLGEPFSWSGEAGRLLMVWISFLGVALAGADRRHMAMDLLRESLPIRLRQWLDIVLSLVILGCLGLLIYHGAAMTEYNLTLRSEHLHISYAFFYAAIPTGLACYLLFEAAYLYRMLKPKSQAS